MTGPPDLFMCKDNNKYNCTTGTVKISLPSYDADCLCIEAAYVFCCFFVVVFIHKMTLFIHYAHDSGK